MGNRAPIRWTTVTLDCSDAEALGWFYAEIFGWEINARDGAGWVQVRDPGGGVGLNLQADDSYESPTWPEQHGRQAKMMHQPVDRDRTRIGVMLDPAAHPFCLFVHGE